MKKTILLLAVFAAILTSCSTSYKTGQTPDDVYYSPSRPQQEDEYVQSEKQDDKYNNDESYDDRYLRMKVRNRTRWSDLDDWYNNDRYSLAYNYYYGSYHNPYNSWNYYYNPYCCCHSNNTYGNPKTGGYVYTKPRMFNLNTYNTNNASTRPYSGTKYNGYSTGSNNNTYTAPRTSNNSSSNNNSNSGNILRNIFNNSNSSSSNNNSNSSSSNSSSSSSSSSSGSSSTSAPVRKF